MVEKFFKVPAMYSTCCKWLFTNFLFFRQNFLSPRYVLHLLQVAVLMYSRYCKWLIFEIFFFRSPNYSKSPQRTPHVASGFLRTFNFFVKIFLSPRYVLHLLQVAVLMYSTYCKWLIFEFFFFALRTIPSPPNVLHMLQVAFEQLFIFWSKFF